jgi:integrase
VQTAEGNAAMSADEVQRLWDTTVSSDYLVWRTLVLTGVRIGELMALERTDLLPDGSLRVDESALERQASTTKNKKVPIVSLPVSLREELDAYIASHQNQLIFPHPDGKMSRDDDKHIRDMIDRARAAAGMPDLTFRLCRTTFATLYPLVEGDIRDAQAILGHHSPAFTLQTYRKPVTARQTAAIEALDQKLKVVPIRKGA